MGHKRACLWLAVMGLIGAIPFLGRLVQFIDPLLIFRDSRRCLHDEIADTTVVNA